MTLTVILVVFFLLAVLPCLWQEHQQNVEFNDKYPPIDDSEFLRLCGPETPADIALKVREIFSQVSGVDEEQIYPDQTFHDLGME